MTRFPRFMTISAALLAFVCGGLLGQAALGGITVDGSLTDWGVTVADSGSSGPNPASSFGGATGVSGYLGSYDEDTDDRSNNYRVGPDWGGQDYDAEFLGVAQQGSTLYIAIVSGQRPDNGPTLFGPGDIRLETSAGIFGIEVGGGLGGNGGATIYEGAPGSTYTLNSNGYTTNTSTAPPNTADPAQTAGSIWRNPVWYIDPIVPGQPTQQLSGGTNMGMADYVFTRNSVTRQHSIIELSFDASEAIGVGERLFSVTWRPSCGNDELIVQIPGGSPPFDVPEPTSLCVWGGLLGLTVSGVLWGKRAARKAD